MRNNAGTTGMCDINDERKTTLFNFGKDLPFDVDSRKCDKATGFRALAPRGNGYALAWGGGGLNFPVLYDADNDGLPATSDGDDSHADRDADGLLDSLRGRERQQPGPGGHRRRRSVGCRRGAGRHEPQAAG